MPMRSGFEDVAPLVQQIRPYAAAHVGPALRQVAEQFRPAAANDIGVFSAHKAVQREKTRQSANRGSRVSECRNILRKGPCSFCGRIQKWRKPAVSFNWHARCYTNRV